MPRLKSVEVVHEVADDRLPAIAAADAEVSRLLAAAGHNPVRAQPLRVLSTRVYAETEDQHATKAFQSRSYLFGLHLASVIAAVVVTTFAVEACRAAFAISYLPPLRFHYLSFQLLWNTQPYSAVYTAQLVKAGSSAFILYILFDAAAVCWKAWQWATRTRDVGYNRCTRRARVDFGFKALRLPLLAGAWCISGIFSSWQLPAITDVFYSASCRLSPAFGRDPSDLALEGDTSGECVSVLSSAAVQESERDYRGQVPDTDPAAIAAGGGNVTVYMDSYGRELGCPVVASVFQQYGVRTGELASAWAPLATRPLRRCLSQKGYIFSNWYTFAPSCDPLAYLSRVNSSGVAAFGHAEQWFCGQRAVTNATHLTVHYNTTGWLASTVGPSCLTRNDTAEAVRPWPQAVVRALANVRGDATPLNGSMRAVVSGLRPDADLPLSIFAAGAPLSVANRSEWSPVAPDVCDEARYACLVRTAAGGQSEYLRALSLHGCRRSVSRPMSTAAYAQALADDQARWGSAVLRTAYAIIAEVVIEWLETALTCLFF